MFNFYYELLEIFYLKKLIYLIFLKFINFFKLYFVLLKKIQCNKRRSAWMDKLAVDHVNEAEESGLFE